MKNLIKLLILFSLLISSCSAHKDEFNKGVSMYKQQKFDEALNHFKKALELNEKYENAAINIATIYYERKDFDNAIIYLKKTLDINGFNKQARYALLTIYFNKGDYQKTYNRIQSNTGKKEAVLFRKLVKALVNNGHNFFGKIKVAKGHQVENLKTEKLEKVIVRFKLFVDSSGKTKSSPCAYTSETDQELASQACKIIHNLKLNSLGKSDGTKFEFRINGELTVDHQGTKITFHQTTFEQIMDSNILRISRPDLKSCWALEDQNLKDASVQTELTINPDGTVKEWKTKDTVKTTPEVAQCIGEKLAVVKYINFPDSSERKLVVYTTSRIHVPWF